MSLRRMVDSQQWQALTLVVLGLWLGWFGRARLTAGLSTGGLNRLSLCISLLLDIGLLGLMILNHLLYHPTQGPSRSMDLGHSRDLPRMVIPSLLNSNVPKQA